MSIEIARCQSSRHQKQRRCQHSQVFKKRHAHLLFSLIYWVDGLAGAALDDIPESEGEVEEDTSVWRAFFASLDFGELDDKRLRSCRKSVILGCSFARLTDAGKDELLLVALVVEVTTSDWAVMARVSLRRTRGCVLTVSKLQSDSESEPETEAGVTGMYRNFTVPFSRSARLSSKSSDRLVLGIITWAPRLSVIPEKHAGADVGGTRSHWYFLWFFSGCPAMKSNSYFLLSSSVCDDRWRSIKIFVSSVSTGPNSTRLTFAAEIIWELGFWVAVDNRNFAISETAIGFHTLALIFATESFQSQIGIILLQECFSQSRGKRTNFTLELIFLLCFHFLTEGRKIKIFWCATHGTLNQASD